MGLILQRYVPDDQAYGLPTEKKVTIKHKYLSNYPTTTLRAFCQYDIKHGT
jgi:hypothetical protein